MLGVSIKVKITGCTFAGEKKLHPYPLLIPDGPHVKKKKRKTEDK